MVNTPDVTVVVSTYNRASRLRALLDSLRSQSLAPERFEVVVVNNGSSDETKDVLDEEERRGGLDLTVRTHERNLGPAGGRNTGWRSARGRLIAFTDDDCRVAPQWLEVGLAAWANDPGRIVQGRTDPDPEEVGEESPFTRTLRVYSLGPYYQTCNVFYPRALLEAVGGFDEAAYEQPTGEDADLAWRCIEAGARPVFAATAQVYHAVQDLGPLGKLRVAWRWHEMISLYARHPGMRATLTYKVFWKKSHYILVRAGLGFLLPRQLRALRFWFVWPVYDSYYARARINGRRRLWSAPFWILHDLVEIVAALRGAIRYRTPVI